MAYSRVRVQFEIGHEASLRTKKTPEGFTHDWEVFVRGADNADIQHFVEKVVFHLHGTFPKPRRTFKEPPYCVKESGYAGFNLPIDIYLKNNNPDQRKLRFYYDLTLQDSGAPVSHLIREEASFTNPSEDFRRKLLMGGGVGVGNEVEGSDRTNQNHSSNSLHPDDAKLSHVSKPKLSSSFSDSQKKHKSKDSSKSEELRGSNSFAALFGAPIRTGKHSPKTSSSSSYSKTSSSTTNEPKTSSHDKQGKESSSKPPKHSPHKEKDKEKESSVVKKEKDPDRSISKEKERRDGSHKEKERSKDKSKRTSSPFLPTSSSSLKPPEPMKKEENKKEESPVKKHSVEEVKEKAPTPKIVETVKTEKKHKEKKSREERERKEGHKEKEHHKKEEKEKSQEKSAKKIEVKEVIKEVKPPKPVEKEEKKMKLIEKEKEKERPHDKHKHKKKDKHKKDEERERQKKKEVVVEKPPEIVKPLPVKPRSPSPPKITRPLNTLIEQMKDSADSDSELSAIEEPPQEAAPPPRVPTPPLPQKPHKMEERKPEIKEERKIKKEKKSREDEGKEVKKRKRKLKDREEPGEKYIKMEVKEEKSPSVKREGRSPSSHRFTDDYVTQLKDLQHKIMTLQDNDDLQRVVQVISETGQFEITQRTFDFDLCALDRSTVKRLQDMFILS